jgi:hypothetical protein
MAKTRGTCSYRANLTAYGSLCPPKTCLFFGKFSSHKCCWDKLTLESDGSMLTAFAYMFDDMGWKEEDYRPAMTASLLASSWCLHHNQKESHAPKELAPLELPDAAAVGADCWAARRAEEEYPGRVFGLSVSIVKTRPEDAHRTAVKQSLMTYKNFARMAGDGATDVDALKATAASTVLQNLLRLHSDERALQSQRALQVELAASQDALAAGLEKEEEERKAADAKEAEEREAADAKEEEERKAADAKE